MGSKTQRFGALIDAEEMLAQPGIHAGFSARLVQPIGFKSATTASAGPSETNLDCCDIVLMGCNVNLNGLRASAACVDIPVSADGDTDYGHAINVDLAVHGFEPAGVDGIMLEDQVWPRHCGHMAGKGGDTRDEEGVARRAVIGRRRRRDRAVDLAVSFQEINELMGFDTIMAMEQRFLTETQREAKYGVAR
jgi:2-methylisocitrate lyase-like PEP mutase family enzyme